MAEVVRGTMTRLVGGGRHVTLFVCVHSMCVCVCVRARTLLCVSLQSLCMRMHMCEWASMSLCVSVTS